MAAAKAHQRLEALLEPAQAALFLALAFCLPLFESPKTIALAGFLGVVLIQVTRSDRPWPALSALEIAVLGVMATAALSGIASTLRGGGAPATLLHGAGQVLLLGLTFLAVYRARLPLGLKHAWMWTVLLSGLLAMGWMAWEAWMVEGASPRLASVGNPNTSSLYLTVIVGVALASLFGALSRFSARDGWLIGLLALTLVAAIASLLYLGSRNAMLGLGVVVVTLAVIALSRRKLLWAALAVVALVTMIWAASPWMTDKFSTMSMESAEALFGPRVDFWRLGAEIVAHHPLVGVGWGNFGTVDPASLGFAFDPASEVANADHAHNQALNLLAETGGLGFVSWAVFLSLAGWRLWTRTMADGHRAMAVRLAGLSAWLILLAGGAFEVTLVDEVAILAIVLIALAVAPAPTEDRPDPARSGRDQRSA